MSLWKNYQQEVLMQIMLRVSLIIASPVLMMVYWRNSMKQLDNIHANYDLKYAE